MEKFTNDRIVYIPGWADLAIFYPQFKGLEIWKENISPEEKIENAIVVAHSLGCHWALLNWEKNRNTKLILINPLIAKENIFVWFFRWINFFIREGKKYVNPKRLAFFFHLPALIKKTVALFKKDFFPVIEKIPSEDILVIRGAKDYFFCTKKIEMELKARKVEVISVEDMGHLWNENIKPILEKIIEKY